MERREKRLPDMRETVASGNVHVETKPGLTAGISGNIKTLDLLLQLLEPGFSFCPTSDQHL